MLTSVEEWSGVAKGSQLGWESRARIIAKLIRSTDTVLDIGAGNQKLARFIPPSCGYIPVDCVDDLPGTFVVDFNKEFRLPDTNFSVVVCAGLLEYLDDIPSFFSQLAEHAPGRQIVFTYLFSPAKLTRSEMRIHNNFLSSEDLLAAIGNSLSFVDVFALDRDTGYYNATLSRSAEVKRVNYSPITELLTNPYNKRGLHRVLSKLQNSVKKRIA